MKRYNVRVTVIRKLDLSEVHGAENVGQARNFAPTCSAFNVGDSFVIERGPHPEGFCLQAFNDIYPWINAIRWGASFPWMEEEGTMVACCTDGLRPVVFRLERIE